MKPAAQSLSIAFSVYRPVQLPNMFIIVNFPFINRADIYTAVESKDADIGNAFGDSYVGNAVAAVKSIRANLDYAIGNDYFRKVFAVEKNVRSDLGNAVRDIRAHEV